ncbi:MAG TPA: GLPGLI family protein [Mucilaginibacter sp.]|jgi:GLPGLI family protein|nr:GLPGLI family protein [Mucilaginibacter sp.]
MKTTIATITCLFLFGCNVLFGQNAHFVTSGIIEYDKTVNMFALLKKQINKDNESFFQPIYDQYVKNQPQFKKLKSTLNFADNKTLFTPLPDENTTNSFFGNGAMVSQNNTIFTDLQNLTFTGQKSVFEETFLIKDSTRKIRWKITDETREIAGYTCRRANAIIMDSIYVVAFYTDQIPVSGGPESFTGLPGMILGVALPHENITWFATKVTGITLDDKAMQAPKKGKQVNIAGLNKTLLDATKDWGTYKDAYLKGFSL